MKLPAATRIPRSDVEEAWFRGELYAVSSASFFFSFSTEARKDVGNIAIRYPLPCVRTYSYVRRGFLRDLAIIIIVMYIKLPRVAEVSRVGIRVYYWLARHTDAV